MRRFYLFRSNIRHLEYYHQYKELETFKQKCHDYYLLLPLWLLEQNYFDEVIIWRLTKNKVDDIVFNVNGRKFIQKWCKNFSETYQYSPADISFWRGGFIEYDEVTRNKPDHFGLKLYLGAGRRILPQWGGKYNIILMEDKEDFVNNRKCLPFYKTASPFIFFPKSGQEKKWDVCWPANFAQIRHKGQEFFIKNISQNKFLRKLKIVNCGNKPKVGRELCKKYGVTNIEFLGEQDRESLNDVLNQSKFGLNMSNRIDGCPRVSTEILMSGTPLILRNTVRLLPHFKKKGVVEVAEQNLVEKIKWGFSHYDRLKTEVEEAISSSLSFDNINEKNIKSWQKNPTKS